MNRIEVAPAIVRSSNMKFYYPPTLIDDFSVFINTDVPNATYTFELVEDWYKRAQADYEPKYIRATYLPINWKSKIGNTDMNSNFKTDYTMKIAKGDIVIRDDGEIFILNWKVQNNPNNQSSQAIAYSYMLHVERKVERTLDPLTGYAIEDAHIETVCPDIPCSISMYAGRPDFQSIYNAPGIAPDHLVTLQVQANDLTHQIRIMDEFDWYHYRYRIIDVYYTEVDVVTKRGLINFNARRIAGAFRD